MFSRRSLLRAISTIVLTAGLTVTAVVSHAEVDTVRINSAAFPISSPIHVAHLLELFEKAGLNVKMQDFPSGAEAMEGFRAGQADFVVTGFLPTSILASNADVKIVSTLAGAEKALIIMSGPDVSSPGDLKGTKIGLLTRSDSAFLLDRYLRSGGLSFDDVELVNLTPSDQMAALKNGDVSAIAVWQPFGLMRDRFFPGQDVKVLADQSTVNMGRIWSSFIASRAFIDENPETTRKVLSVLQEAKEWMDNASEAELTELLAGYYRLEPEMFQAYFPMWKPRLNLTDKVAGEMSTMMNWALGQGIIEKSVDFKAVFASDVLGSVSPSLLSE